MTESDDLKEAVATGPVDSSLIIHEQLTELNEQGHEDD